MLKLIFIIFYEPKDFLSAIKKYFEKYSIEVITYPLFKYVYDANDKILNYKEHLSSFIVENNPDIVLWWFIDVSEDVFKYVKNNNLNKYFVIYNSDDPHNLDKNIFDKCKYFDLVLTPCEGSIYKYKIFSKNQNAIFAPYGFDHKTFFPIHDASGYDDEILKYQCDISIYCYNLFLGERYKHQYVSTVKLIEDIINYSTKNKLIFRLYGSPIIKELFPTHYHGELEYYNINLLYNFSKINITTHGNCNESLALNHHIMSILGSGGLLFVDKLKHLDKILIDRTDCVVIDKNKYIDQIDSVLKNYDAPIYNTIKKNGNNVAQSYTWREWVKKIVMNYGRTHFNAKLYAELYDLNPVDNLLNYWLTHGVDNYEICYSFDVPKNFCSQAYATENNLSGKSTEYIYHHWFKNSKNQIYFELQQVVSILNIDAMGISCDQYHKICRILSKIRTARCKEKYLLKLGKVCEQIPSVDINGIIEKYLSSIP